MVRVSPDERLRRGLRLRGEMTSRIHVGGGWGLIIPSAVDQAEPSRPGRTGPARSSSGALQLDPHGLARSLTGGRRQTG